MGPPRLWGIRTLAIANGSECATGQGYGPYTQMMTGNGSVDFGYFSSILLSVWETALTQNPLKYFEGYLTTSSNFSVTTEIRSLPDQQSQRIFYFDLYYHKNILGGLIQSGSDVRNFSFNSQASMFPLDNYPGGIFDVRNFAQIPTNISLINLSLPTTRFNFIPTTSSLDIGSGSQTIGSADLLRTYSPTAPPVAPKNVPYNNFFTNPLSNENHATLTINNAKWLWQEMQGTPAFFSCSYSCAGTNLVSTINGSSLLCNSTSFSINNLPSNATITWSSSNINGLTINSSGVGVRANNYNGPATVTATISGSCDNTSAQKTVWVGPALGIENFENSIPGYFSTSDTYKFRIAPAVPNSTLKYFSSNNWSVTGGMVVGGDSGELWVQFTTNGYATVTATPDPPCGAGPLSLTVLVGQGGCPDGDICPNIVYPNPASDELTVLTAAIAGRGATHITLRDPTTGRWCIHRVQQKKNK
ncbi:MAG: hypothetical protein JST69_14215 [Bacteroidetes bacterium]|nr:hypothetical protein [Bacteroidota bacterium]